MPCTRAGRSDGKKATTIRSYGLDEAADDTAKRFAHAEKELLNNGNILTLTQPGVIGDKRFLDKVGNIIETNTFSATVITQSEFFVGDPREHGGRKDPAFYQGVLGNPFLRDLAWEMNVESVLPHGSGPTRSAVEAGTRYVAGAVGPLTVSLSVSPDADDASFRVVTFDQVAETYRQQIRALIAGGCDILMVETIFDSLNAKAALVACQEVFARGWLALADHHIRRGGPGRGNHDLRADHGGVLACGGPCQTTGRGAELLPGPDLMRPFLEELWPRQFTSISCYPNAGLPNPLSPTGFDLTPLHMGDYLREFAESRLVNLVGGCCGNTPEHVAAIAGAVAHAEPHCRCP